MFFEKPGNLVKMHIVFNGNLDAWDDFFINFANYKNFSLKKKKRLARIAAEFVCVAFLRDFKEYQERLDLRVAAKYPHTNRGGNGNEESVELCRLYNWDWSEDVNPAFCARANDWVQNFPWDTLIGFLSGKEA